MVRNESIFSISLKTSFEKTSSWSNTKAMYVLVRKRALERLLLRMKLNIYVIQSKDLYQNWY